MLLIFLFKSGNISLLIDETDFRNVSVVEIYENFENRAKDFPQFLNYNRDCIGMNPNLKNLFQQFLDISFIFILKQTVSSFMLPWTREMFRTTSTVLGLNAVELLSRTDLLCLRLYRQK